MALVHTELRSLNPLGVPRWDDLVSAFPGHTIFHTKAWAQVLAGAYGYSPLYQTEFEADRPVSILPLMEVDSRWTGRRGICLPFTDACPTLASEADAHRRLFQSAIELGKRRNWKHVEFRGGWPPADDAVASLEFYGHTLDLTAGEQKLFAGVESSVRRAIRKSDQAGLTVYVTRDLEGMRTFYALHCRTRKRHGLPPQPFGFFRRLQERILDKGRGWIVMARAGRTPVAAAVFLHLGKRALYKFGASDDEYQKLRGNNRVMWEAIRRYANDGFETLDFGRTSIGNEGLRRFKLGWGTVESRIAYYKYCLRTDKFILDRDATQNALNGIFRSLPIFSLKWLGTALYRHIA